MTFGSYRSVDVETGWWRHLLVGIVLTLCVVVVYLPGLTGPFVFDDFENIIDNPPVALTSLNSGPVLDALLANDSGPFGRPLASITFALNYYFAGGFTPLWFKLTNLFIHLINAWLVYALLLAIAATPRLRTMWSPPRQRLIAALTAAAWALHPIQITSVLYVVQRMTSLSAMFVLAGAIAYLYLRERFDRGDTSAPWLMGLALYAGVILGMTAKETAVLLPLFAIVIEYTLFQRERLKAAQRRRLAFFYAAVLALPVALFLLYLLLHPAFVTAGYVTRNFTLWQRLLTETRVLWMYVGLLIFPVPSRFSLFHDYIDVSNSLYEPVTTALAVAGLSITIWFAVYRPRLHSAIKFGILWFLAGHLLESSVFGLDLAYEHRNYLPSIGLVFALLVGGARLIERVHWRFAMLGLSASAVVAVLGFSTWVRAGEWSDTATLAYTTAYNHPASPRANSFAARVSLRERNDPVTAIRYTLRGLALRPREPGFHIDLQMMLATLSKDLEERLRASGQNQRGVSRPVQVAGLDETLEWSYVDNRGSLRHPASDLPTVEQLLQQSVISVRTVVSLENLRRCIVEPPQPCGATHALALRWHTIALQNPRSSGIYRGLIAASAARLAASQGQPQLALEYMNRAIEFAPGQLSFRLGALDYLLQLDQLGPANLMLQTIHHTDWPRADWAANKDALQRLERRRTARNSPLDGAESAAAASR